MRKFRGLVFARRYAIPIAVCSSALAIWITRLFRSSLWLDETITYWIAKDGFSDAIHRSLAFQSTGPLYFLFVWVFTHLLPRSEAGLRILSVLAFLILVFVMFKLARFCLDTEGAVTATLLFTASEGVLPTLANARPYALSMLLLTTCAYCMMLWLKNFRLRYLALYVLTGVFSFYTHYLLMPVVFVFSLYITLLSGRSDAEWRRRLVHALAALGALVVMTIPSVPHLRYVQSRKGILQFSAMPTLDSIMEAWFPARLLLAVTIAFLFILAMRRPMHLSWPKIAARHGALLLGWYAFPPLCLFMASHLLNASMFNPRYLIWSIPAGAILTAYGIRIVKPRRVRAVLMWLSVSLLLFASVRDEVPRERWSEATRWIRKEIDLRPGTVLASPMLVEAADTAFMVINESRDYLLSPFSFYHLETRVVPLPFWFDQDGAREYMERSVRPMLDASEHAFLVARIVDMRSSPNRLAPMIRSDLYYQAGLSRLGWRVVNQESFGSVTVITLRR